MLTVKMTPIRPNLASFERFSKLLSYSFCGLVVFEVTPQRPQRIIHIDHYNFKAFLSYRWLDREHLARFCGLVAVTPQQLRRMDIGSDLAGMINWLRALYCQTDSALKWLESFESYFLFGICL